jgi:hypothetical protein
MSFTQQDMVTLFPPPGTTAGVRVGWVQGDINGTITINSILTATPPTFTATGTAVIVDTNGDQLFLNVAFNGTFAPGSSPPPSLYAVAGAFKGTYTVTGGTGNLITQFPATTVFNGTGVAVQPQVAPPGAPSPAGFGPGAAFSQFSSSQKGGQGQGGPKPKLK